MSAQKQLAPRIAELRQYCREAEHGTRARYMTGCRCLRCRAANSNYNTSRRAAIENGDFRGLVSVERARAKTPALQLRQDFITAKSALAVERLLKKLDAGLLRRDR